MLVVVDVGAVVLTSMVAVAQDIGRLTVGDRTTSCTSVATTGLMVLDCGVVALMDSVVVTSDNNILLVVNYSCGIASMGGKS